MQLSCQHFGVGGAQAARQLMVPGVAPWLSLLRPQQATLNSEFNSRCSRLRVNLSWSCILLSVLAQLVMCPCCLCGLSECVMLL